MTEEEMMNTAMVFEEGFPDAFKTAEEMIKGDNSGGALITFLKRTAPLLSMQQVLQVRKALMFVVLGA